MPVSVRYVHGIGADRQGLWPFYSARLDRFGVVLALRIIPLVARPRDSDSNRVG